MAAELAGAASKKKLTPEEQEEVEEEPMRPIRKTSAPPPIRPVGGSATRSTVPIDELDYQSFRKIRDQQEKAHYHR